MLPELKTLLTYRNIEVLRRYTQDFPDATLSARQAFREMLKFMWLSLKAQAENKKFSCDMHEEMLDIDNMWHTFLLFTKDYHLFCEKYLGQFFHHQPHSPKAKKPAKKVYEKHLTEYLTYIYDNLGARTLRFWFKEAT